MITTEEFLKYLPAEVRTGRFRNEDGSYGNPVRLYRIVGQESKGWLGESQYRREALTAHVNALRKRP